MSQENQQFYNKNFQGASRNPNPRDLRYRGSSSQRHEAPPSSRALIKYSNPSEILTQLNSGQLLVVDSRRRCGLIILKRFHAEFAGPGAAVGGIFDLDCQQTIPIGDLVLLYPESYSERQKAFTTRRQWIRVMEQIAAQPVPLQRAQMLLTQFQHYFDRDTVARLPEEAIARLIGVLPQTVRMLRQPTPSLNAIASV